MLLLAAALTVVSCASELILPLIVEDIVNRGVLRGSLDVVCQGSVRMLGMAVVLALSGFGTFMSCSLASERFARDLRERLYRKVTEMSVMQVEKFGSGSLITRLTSDVDSCAALANVLLQLLLEPALLMMGGILIMWRISHRFDMVFVFFILMQCAFVLLFVRKTMPLFLGVQRSNDRMNAYLQTELRCLPLIKAFTGEGKEARRFESLSEEIRSIQLEAKRWTALFNPMVMLVVNILVACILMATEGEVRSGGLLVGSVMAAVTYAEQTLLSIVISGKFFGFLAQATPSAERIAQVLREEPEIRDGAKRLEHVGGIALNEASFRYPDGVMVFPGLSMHIAPGDFIAVCGGVGCGKTTLARILCRVYDVSSGEVLVNGKDIRDFRLSDVRRNITVVEKDMDIAEGTIESNILCGREDVTSEAVFRAVRAAGLEEFVRRLPEGLETDVLSGGASLSGGERQRLAIARALAGNPGVLVMDDCTSCLDYATENNVVRSIRKNYPDTAVVLMTQRVLSVQTAERVVCIERDGRVSVGTAECLKETSALFSELYRSQGGRDVEG